MDAATIGGVGLLLSNTVLLIRLSFAVGKAAGQYAEQFKENDRRIMRLEDLTDSGGAHRRYRSGGSHEAL